MSTELLSTNQCSHINAAGRRCRMTIAPTHDTLCTHHLQRQAAAQPDPEALAAELLENTGNLNTADRVNALLANTVKQFARQRIDRQDALAFGYLAQMLLNTVPGVQKEHQAIRTAEARQALRNSIAESQARRRPGQPAVAGMTALTSSTGLPRAAKGTPVHLEPRRACAVVATDQKLAGSSAHAADPQRAEGDVSSRAQRGILAGSLSVRDQKLPAPPSNSLAHLSNDAELSDEALLAVVLQATSPQQRR